MVISLSTIRQKAWSDLCNNAAIYSRRSKYIACSQISYKLLLEYFLKAMNLKYHRGERLITQRSHGKLKMTFFPKRILSKGNKIKSTVFCFFFYIGNSAPSYDERNTKNFLASNFSGRFFYISLHISISLCQITHQPFCSENP